MTIINVRSPFVVSIGDYGGTQKGSRVKLSIYQKGVTPPTSGNGFYSLSKNIVSSTQRETQYNISNYVKEFFNHTYQTPQGSTPLDAPVEDWLFVDVELSWYNGSTYTIISTTTYVALDGYTNYLNGANQQFGGQQMYILLNDNFERIVNQGNIRTFNLLAEVPNAGNKVDVVYSTIYEGSPYIVTIPAILPTDPRGIYNKKIRFSIDSSTPQFIDNSHDVQIKWYASTIVNLGLSLQVKVMSECKYDVVECTYINKRGGWEFIPFFKAQTNSISVKNTEYKLTQTALNYNPKIGQTKTMNINGTQTIKLNTGWVDEKYSELITDLLLSETILLDDKPVNVKTQSSELKTYLRNKNINYEVEFEYSYNLINNAL